MSKKVSLDKNSEAQINEKLDFIIGEIQNLQRDINALKSNVADLQEKNQDQLYRLDSRFYRLCGDLQNQLYKFQSEFYSGSRNIKEELRDLQEKTGYSRFMDKVLPWSPLIIAGGTLWAVVMFNIFG